MVHEEAAPDAGRDAPRTPPAAPPPGGSGGAEVAASGCRGWFLSAFVPGGDPLRLIVVLMLVTCFLGLKSRFINPDSAGYYMFILSPVLDGDADYANDLDRMGIEPVYRANNFRPGAGGRTINPFAIGSPMLLAPFFLAAHPLAVLARAAGWSDQPLWHWDLDGLYYKTMIVGNALLAAGTFYLMYFLARRFASVEGSLWTILLCWFATPLPAYIYLYGNHSHLVSASAGALVLWLWMRTADRREPRHYALIGMAAGLAALVRWQDALSVLVVLVPLARPPAPFRCLAAAAAGFWGVFSVQLLEWLVVHGTIFVQPPAPGFMQWFNPQISGLLLSARMGLFTWHPVFLIALVGLRHLARRDRILTAGVALMFVLQVYVNAAVPDWWGGNSFGQRRMMGILPFLALGLAAFYDATVRSNRRIAGVAWGLGGALCLWNLLLFFQYYHQKAFFDSGLFDFPSIASNQLRVLAQAEVLVLPFFAETLWAQLGAIAVPGRVVVLAAWAAMIAGGMVALRRLRVEG